MTEAKRPRQSNFEVLRILAIVMILFHHFVICTSFPFTPDYETNLVIYRFMEAYGKIGVGIFVLITGYFCIDRRLTIRKVLTILVEVWFYSIVISLVLLYYNKIEIDPDTLALILFPVTYDHWWYVTFYLALMLVSPVINYALNRMDQKQHLVVVAIIFFAVMVLPSISGRHDFGNNLFLFIGYYVLGAYFRLHPDRFSSDWRPNAIIAAAVSLFMLVMTKVIINEFIELGPTSPIEYEMLTLFGVSIVLLLASLLIFRNIYVTMILGILLSFVSILVQYKSVGLFATDLLYEVACPTVIISAVTIFLVFKNINIRSNRAINWIASSTFGIYLIHTHFGLYYRFWIKENVDYTEKLAMTTPDFLVYAFTSVFTVFAICLIIDKIRVYLIFKPLSPISRRISDKIERFVDERCPHIKSYLELK